MAKIRFWKWQYTDPLGREHVMRSPLSRERAPSVLDEPEKAEWSLPLGEGEKKSLSDFARGTPK
jgi:hypothetical protein